MNLAQFSMPELVGTLLGFMFTLFVFSYIFGDNALFRIAMSIFVGVASAYAGVVAWYNVVWPQLLRPLIFGTQSERLFVLIPLFFCGLLLLKISPRFSRFSNPAMAYMVGVGVAAAIGGAVLGTIFPQISATINLFDMDVVRVEERCLAAGEGRDDPGGNSGNPRLLPVRGCKSEKGARQPGRNGSNGWPW